MNDYEPSRLWILICCIAALRALGDSAAEGAETQASSRPNVLFIAIDDLNDYVSVLRDHPGLKTPNLDRFAKKALTFTQAYCAGPICNPSRAAILSGLAPYRTGIYQNSNPIFRSQPIVQASLIPEHFHAHGYSTYWAGKIFHTRPLQPRLGKMWTDMSQADGGYGPRPSSAGPGWFVHEAWQGPDSDFADVRSAEFTVKQLQADHEKPFFIATGFYRPHTPWTAPARFFDRYPLEDVQLPKVREDDLADVPPVAQGYARRSANWKAAKESGEWKTYVRAYLACISFMDESLGKVLDALEASKYRDNTVVVLWADHGFHQGEKEHFAKSALWEQTTHTLFMWHVPGVTEDGGKCPRTASLLDIYPTLVELCNLAAPKQALDGRSLVPLLKDPASPWDRPAITTYLRNDHAVRDERWRYIRYHDGSEELYDHSQDPLEWTNLAEDLQHLAVKQSLAKHLPSVNVAPVPPAPAAKKDRKKGARKNKQSS